MTDVTAVLSCKGPVKLKLIDKKQVAKDTKEFYFEPEKEVNWLPGQYFYFTIPESEMKYKDPRGNTHHFTLCVSPTEGKNIALATRMRTESNYKKSLNEVEIGQHLEGQGPEGTFILDENEKGEHVLIAGGIGITPFRSMIKYNVDKNLTDIKLKLIYANSTPEEISFREEIETWGRENENIEVYMTCSHPENSKQKWTGLTGRIDEKMIKNVAGDLSKPTFWLCGPPAMTEAMEKVMGGLKITSDRLRVEKFTGY